MLLDLAQPTVVPQRLHFVHHFEPFPIPGWPLVSTAMAVRSTCILHSSFLGWPPDKTRFLTSPFPQPPPAQMDIKFLTVRNLNCPSRFAFRPATLSCNPCPSVQSAVSPFRIWRVPHSAFSDLLSYCFHIRAPSYHRQRAAPNPRWAIWRKKMNARGANRSRPGPADQKANGARPCATPQPQQSAGHLRRAHPNRDRP